MEDKSHIRVNNLLYSCVDQKQRGNEQFVHEHALGYIISGESHIISNSGTKIFKAGTIGLIRRNQLVKSLKIPPPGGEFRSINIFLDQDFLRRYNAEHQLNPVGKYTGDSMRLLSDDPFLKGYFDSLLPYFNNAEQPKMIMAELKTNEAVELLLRLDSGLKNFLFDFSEPYKIDL